MLGRLVSHSHTNQVFLLRLQIPGSSDKRVLSMDVLKVAYFHFVLKIAIKIAIIQLLVQFLKVDNRRQAGWE